MRGNWPGEKQEGCSRQRRRYNVGDTSGSHCDLVWASGQGEVEERPSNADKGRVLSFCESSKGREERIQVYEGKFIVRFPKFCIPCCLSLGKVTTLGQRRKWEPSFSFFFFFFFNTTLVQHVWFPVQALCFLYSAFVLQFKMCGWGSYSSLDLSPSSSRLAIAQPGTTIFSGEIKLIDSLMSCNFTCHKFQAAKSNSVITRGAFL